MLKWGRLDRAKKIVTKKTAQKGVKTPILGFFSILCQAAGSRTLKNQRYTCLESVQQLFALILKIHWGWGP